MPDDRYWRPSMFARCSLLWTHALKTFHTDGPIPMFSPQHLGCCPRSFVHMLELWKSVREFFIAIACRCAVRSTSWLSRSAAEPVLDAVVVHEHVELLAGARGSEAAGMRHTRREGGEKHGDDRDGGGGASKTHAASP